MESLDNYIQALNHLLQQELIDTKPILLSLQPGEIIFHADEAAQHIFGVQTGKIQLVRYLETGHISHQYGVENGMWFGEDALFNAVYQNSAIATQPSKIIAIPQHTFLTLLRHDPEISLIFVGQLAEQLYTAKTIMTLRCIRSAYARVLAYLNALKPSGKSTFVLNCSVKEIAEQICLTPEVVSRALRKLQDDGIIQRHQRKVSFLKQ
ncbi:Crp/Fnr family transcriptional regulator [Leptothoe sp. PORK10 BA2]|uniref:Crp/Fnr family transcriptional regulator n=1 Tax=Leptothoe sp. PORK10 BA2 TaxID=3110254 RepID=UPI002B21EE96|nr:Crp/Fnr family transcriptional regulator [Leptothoe sp. PORK10 BA2]MEA5462606.1 Crp/Fnr family transcriptional regulator [Leptothoe sp. PORK10 BA2]